MLKLLAIAVITYFVNDYVEISFHAAGEPGT